VSQTKMFVADGKRVKTYNLVVGCLHACTYCYARDLAEGRLRHLPRYRDGFKPKLVESELRRRFRGGTVFVSDMGELFGPWVPADWIEAVLEATWRSPEATFLFLTKNPERYFEFLGRFPRQAILGATVETNNQYTGISKAPPPWHRLQMMRRLRECQPLMPLMLSLEPIMDFDVRPFVEMIQPIRPEFLYVGYDNHDHHLPEPHLAKTRELIAALGEFTEVRVKTLREAWWVERSNESMLVSG